MSIDSPHEHIPECRRDICWQVHAAPIDTTCTFHAVAAWHLGHLPAHLVQFGDLDLLSVSPIRVLAR
jgi:hypothetical protein